MSLPLKESMMDFLSKTLGKRNIDRSAITKSTESLKLGQFQDAGKEESFQKVDLLEYAL